jgi:hypothetical protein
MIYRFMKDKDALSDASFSEQSKELENILQK